MDLPSLPLESWRKTKVTFHLYAQIIGKIRMALHPKLNHWWHVPLYLSARGLTTQAIPRREGLLEIEFDFIDHRLVIKDSHGGYQTVTLHHGLSVAQFYEMVLASLGRLGVQAELRAEPYDPPRVGSSVPFAEDHDHAHYDPEYIRRFWDILCWVDAVFLEFKAQFSGKHTPVHLFWHSLDLTYTRFSGRETPAPPTSMTDREAYSHEVISFGFWAGDDHVTEPSFYSYTYPEPKGISQARLMPTDARWVANAGSSMALLPYERVRLSKTPEEDLLAFLESAYLAGAKLANWDIDGLKHDYALNVLTDASP